jgi:hypothetical protein
MRDPGKQGGKVQRLIFPAGHEKLACQTVNLSNAFFIGRVLVSYRIKRLFQEMKEIFRSFHDGYIW